MSAPNLVIVAHPDDETIFFGGLMMSLSQRSWRVVVVTDGNADGLGQDRRRQFAESCARMGVSDFEMWDFPDRFEDRLDVDKLTDRLSKEKARIVYTHGAIGEYGHPHHQDVSWAVHRAFKDRCPVWSPAYNAFATKIVRLTKSVYKRKADILARIYRGETVRFGRFLPLQPIEAFLQLNFSEVEHLYAYLTGASPRIEAEKLKAYRWFEPYLEEQRKASNSRPF